MSDWHIYLVRTRFGALYTGITTDVARRLAEHEEKPAGAKYLRSKGPLELVYETKLGSRALALRVEQGIKGLSKQDKETLVANRPDGDALLVFLGMQTTD